ncbi:MAG TPA: RidA family protein [Polyangia bacterium]|nr:RidA family protein [Polyangia bacterium]
MSSAIKPEGWARPAGFSHGMMAAGRILAVAGQVGADRDGELASGLVAQFDRALANVAEVVAAGGGRIEDVVSMTVYVLDRAAYLAARPALGEVWRRRAGRHYPAMTLVEVRGLVTEGALVEVQALAVLP